MTEHNTTGPGQKPDEFPESSRAEPRDAAESAGNTDCEFAPRVSAYHDGEVSQDEAREVTRHITGCAACAAQLAFFGRVSSTFEAASVPHLAPEARQRLEGLGDQFQSNRLRIKPSADVRWVRRLTAAAAILFIVAVSKVIYEHQFASPGTPTVTPASGPGDRAVPSPQPVSDGQRGGPSSRVPPDSKAPAVTDADYVAGQPAPRALTTGPAERP
jgi:anti-sigma factor RsiW